MLLAGSLTGPAEAAPRLCVGGPHCYPDLQSALDAAPTGSVVRLGRGTVTGGVTILRDVRLRGAGVGVSLIRGGGPVVTIGSATTSPTVSLSGVKITGGLTSTNPQAPRCGPDVPTCGPGYSSATALGGGVEAFPGSTVRIENSAIVRNRARPARTVPSVKAVCPGPTPCPAGFGDAAGIDNWGTMTLIRTAVSDNRASGPQSQGGGIVVEAGATMTIAHSRVTHNRVTAPVPYGRFANGGGIFVDGGGNLDVRHSRIDGNRATLKNALPHPFPMQDGGTDTAGAVGGGVFLGDGSSATIRHSTLDRNHLIVSSPTGEPFGADAALCACGNSPLVLDHVRATGNVLSVDTLSSADVGPSAGIVEADGDATIRHARIVGNRIRVTTPTGDAQALGTLLFFFGGDHPPSVTDSTVARNTVTATAPTGSATVQGAAILNNGPLLLRRDTITRNRGNARGKTGFAQGGGIWNGVLFGGPTSPLTLDHTRVTRNVLTGTPGLALKGGGIYTPGFPTTLHLNAIRQNTPDQCFGC